MDLQADLGLRTARRSHAERTASEAVPPRAFQARPPLPIYAQINPEVLGQDFMDLTVAEKYCERLNKSSRNLKPGAIHRLVYEYPTHDFVIDFEEASELFESVEQPTVTLISLLIPSP